MAYSCAVFRTADTPLDDTGREVRPRLPQARLAPRTGLARRRRRLGRADPPRRRALRGEGGRGDAVATPAGMGAESKRAGGARPLGAHVPARLPGPPRSELRRDLLDRCDRALRHLRARPLLRHHGGPPQAGWSDAQPLHHTSVQPRVKARDGSSTATCSPTASCRDRERSSARCTTTASSYATENLREHYALTLKEWGANLERHWQQAVAEVGERRARVWRLYMAYSRVGFDLGRIQIHQMLGVRNTGDGSSGMPLRPTWEQRNQRTDTRAHELAAESPGT